jgi:hypothetical protein
MGLKSFVVQKAFKKYREINYISCKDKESVWRASLSGAMTVHQKSTSQMTICLYIFQMKLQLAM